MDAKCFKRVRVFRSHKDVDPKSHFRICLIICAAVCLATTAASAETTVTDFLNGLRDTGALAETDFAALSQGHTVVNLLPAKDDREVAVSGVVGVEVSPDVFLQSFRDSMTRKVNPAILEIGRFTNAPSPADLQNLTIEEQDIDDLRECTVGECRLKLSAGMIERFQKEIDWDAPDYKVKASELFKSMLADYVRDYLARGEAALIEYNDKAKAVRMAEEQRALLAGSTYFNHLFSTSPQRLRDKSNSQMSVVEDAIVWSKIKFGLKPVIAINHIVVYRREQAPQVLVESKQIYANHYFDSSLALTAFVNSPGAHPSSYLFYENRSRADGLGGAFGKIKRGIVEGKAIDGLKSILESSRANLNAHAWNLDEGDVVHESPRHWRVRRIPLFLLLLLIAGSATWYTVSNYTWKAGLSGRVNH